jgi:hypothetical protein
LASPYSIILAVTVLSLVRTTWAERWDGEIGEAGDAGGESDSLVKGESGVGWTPSVS